jgi:hypothetical protein
MQVFICRIDSEDKIVFVDGHWLQFAGENGFNLGLENIVGKPLWEFLSDLTTRHLYRIFARRVRQSGKSLTMPFRCDAPDRRRFMQMTILRLPENGLEFLSQLLREEPRPVVPLLAPEFPRTHEMIEMCSWCKKIKAPDWVEVEEGVLRLKLFDKEKLPWVSHSICPQCDSEMSRLAINGGG